MLHVSGRVGHASFHGRLTVCDKVIDIISMAEPAGTDASKHGVHVRMESKGPNNVFRIGWYVCGRTKMKDYIRRNETDVPAI